MARSSWLEGLKTLIRKPGDTGCGDSDQSLRFDGIYFSFRDDVEYLRVGDVRARSIPSSSFLKFYPDGLTIFATVSCSDISRDVPQVIKWFKRDWKEAYRTEFQQDGSKLRFCFDHRLVFDGRISDDGTIGFRIHNQANDKKWKEQFVFWAE
jgi:hypothetical protein